MKLHIPHRSIFTTAALFFFISVVQINMVVLASAESADLNGAAVESKQPEDGAYQQYLGFFEEVYQSMEANYYKGIKREDFDRFIVSFKDNIYNKLTEEGKSNDFIRWRSAAYMVDFLKSPEDIFSAFFPPKPAKEYEETALGKKIDLGIEGKLIDKGYQIEHVEPRSDAYEKGLRPGDLIVKVNKFKAKEFNEEKIKEWLNPVEGSLTKIQYISQADFKKINIEVLSKEYFRQTVFLYPVPIEGIYCLEIRKFNRKTSDDLFRYLTYFRMNGNIKGLILDLRNNPGGPPLAAREISSFFLKPKEDFAVFMKRGEPIAKLDVPVIPDEYHYYGPLVILVNEESGSASELFSGILQKKERAILMGTNSAGQVMLKSMYHFSDDSMLLLVTARGHHSNGDVFSFQGLVPNRYVEENDQDNLVKYAATYLLYVTR